MKKNNKAGFSLVELMVVVAIIGILATVAVPNFQRFQARAKQASAKTELTAIYTAQKAFYVEYNSYTPDLQLTGFVPDGIILGANANIVAAEVPDRNRIYGSTAGVIGAGGAGAGGALAFAALGLTQSTDYRGAYPANATGCAAAGAGAVATVAALGATNRDTFTAAVAGCPRGNGSYANLAATDQWTITQNRVLTNTVSGI